MSVKILKNIYGFKGSNDIVFVGGKIQPRFNVIYLGGDIQDLHSNMKMYSNYSLESTATKLYNRYAANKCPVHVFAIRPSQYKYSTFSIFSNFVEMIEEGHPIYTLDPLKSAANQLQNLILSSIKALLEDKIIDIIPNIDLPIHLIGFSKGCCVLTQLLYDFSQIKDIQLYKVLNCIREIIWLDSGHNGNAELWPISLEIIDNVLKNFNCCLHGFGTPFQLKRFNRERSYEEYNKFEEILQSINVKNNCGFLLQHEKNDLETHFKILDVFPLFCNDL